MCTEPDHTDELSGPFDWFGIPSFFKRLFNIWPYSSLAGGLFICVITLNTQMFKYSSAILFGVTIGFISLIPLQALTNSQARNKCSDTPVTHTLVSVRAFAGDADYCVGNQYLTPDRTVTHYGPGY